MVMKSCAPWKRGNTTVLLNLLLLTNLLNAQVSLIALSYSRSLLLPFLLSDNLIFIPFFFHAFVLSSLLLAFSSHSYFVSFSFRDASPFPCHIRLLSDLTFLRLIFFLPSSLFFTSTHSFFPRFYFLPIFSLLSYSSLPPYHFSLTCRPDLPTSHFLSSSVFLILLLHLVLLQLI